MTSPRRLALHLLSALALTATLVLAVAAAPVAHAQPTRTVTEADARAFLDRWLAAQNEGDFARYGQLYGERFGGTRMSGPVTRTFDRAGWLKDRGDMFGRKMEVSAADVRVTLLTGAAVLDFTQTWASGGYKDVGRKEMVVVRRDGALEIISERMQTSTVVGSAATPAPLARETFAFVASSGDTSYMLLGPGRAEWASGEPELLSTSVLVRAPVDDARVPADVRAWVGRTVTVLDSHGKACTAKVERLWLLSSYGPHFGQVNRWMGRGDFEGEPAYTDAQIAAEAFGGEDTTRIVGSIDGCSGSWARVEEEAKPVRTLVPGVAGETLRRAALAAFRKLPAYKAVQKDFRTYGHRGAWDTWNGNAPSVVTLEEHEGRPALVAVVAQAGHGCGDFTGSAWAVWEVPPERSGRPRLVLLTDPKDPGPFFSPLAAADVDGDGDFELMSHLVLMSLVDGVYRVALDWTPPDYDCPC